MTNLKKQLKSLKGRREAGSPGQDWILSNKEIMMSQIQPQSQSASANREPRGYFGAYLLQLFQQRIARPAAFACLVVFIYLGYTAMVTAALASLPGDMLYPVKTTTEQLQLALTFNDENKVKLQMDFVSRRGDELQQLAKNPDDNNAKKDKISQTMKKISQDVKTVNDNLNKVAAADQPGEAISLAKEVDDKTLQVEKAIVDAHASLSADVKKDVAADVKDALNSTSQAGMSALGVIVDKAQDQGANGTISETEISDRVAQRIEGTETSLQAAVSDAAKAASTSLPQLSSTGTAALLASSTIAVGLASSTAGSSTSNAILDKPKQAAQAIEQAKDLLDKKDFSSALAKVQESKALVSEVVEKTTAVTAANALNNPVDKSAATGDNNVSSTTASSTVSTASTTPPKATTTTIKTK